MQFKAILLALAVVAAPVSAVRHGKATYYAPGVGSCGKSNGPNDMIVAVAAKLFDTYPGHTANPNLNPICGKRIKIRHGKKVAYARVVDKCPGCSGMNDLDMSPALFKKLGQPLSKAPCRWCGTLRELP
ncbi:loosenin [Auriculariales sp. MPI-PUGE-AT-0066]|nr:loosenin [Auriculariales sp. MPI-PUGE-AT-0066]